MNKNMAVLEPLRGDFFCLPFGEDNSWNGEFHPLHGETSGDIWSLVPENTNGQITLKMETSARKGSILKKIQLKDGENNLYISHDITGFVGPAPLGHHVIFPGGTYKYISTSPIRFGYTNSNRDDYYGAGIYHSLASFRRFENLEKVPTVWKEKNFVDCTVFPAREGFEDVVQVYNRTKSAFAWTAVSVPEERYLWFALKDPEILPSTVLWMENKGEHQPPWNGRNCCLGVEDICSYFTEGLSASAEKNFLNNEGIKTYHQLKEDTPLSVKYIQGVVRIPVGFDRVENIVEKNDGVEITSFSGNAVFTKVDSEFLAL